MENKESHCFCPEKSCNFSGSPQSLIDHVKNTHKLTVHEFNYGTDFKVLVPPKTEYTFLSAKEDGSLFILWSRVLRVRLLNLDRVGPMSSKNREMKFQIRGEGYKDYDDHVYKGATMKGIVSDNRLEKGIEITKRMLIFCPVFQHPVSGDFNILVRIEDN